MKPIPILLAAFFAGAAATLTAQQPGAGDPFIKGDTPLAAAAPPAPDAAPRRVMQGLVRSEYFSLPHTLARKMMRQFPQQPALYEWLGKELENPQSEVKLEHLSLLKVRGGQRSKLEETNEYRYPTEFDPPQIPQTYDTRAPQDSFSTPAPAPAPAPTAPTPPPAPAPDAPGADGDPGDEEIDVVVGLERGADDFIPKPFGKRELLARVRSALRRRASRKGQAAPSFALHDLTVFPDELRAARGTRSIELTPREAAMLRLLHEHAGCPVHRDTFLDRCRGLDYFPESRTLDQHIAQLRRKIEPDAAVPTIIETVRGVGYRYRSAEG